MKVVTLFAGTLHRSATYIQSASCHATSLRYIFMLSCLCFRASKWSHSFRLFHLNFLCISVFFHMFHMPTCPIILDVIAITVFDNIFCGISFFLGPDILEQPQHILFFLYCERPSSTPIQKKSYVVIYFNIHIF